MTSTFETKDDRVIKSVFSYYTKRFRNSLDFDDLDKFCRDFGLDLYEPQFKYIDRDDDGMIKYDEFKEWWLNENKHLIFTDGLDNLMSAYELYKKIVKNYGPLKYENFRRYNLKESSHDVSIEYFSILDEDNDDKLNFYEFCNWLKWF